MAAELEAALGRPRALVVGRPPGWPLAGLAEAFEATSTGPEVAVEAVRSGSADVILLDGRLPAPELTSVLEEAGPPGRAARPAILVITDGGSRTQVEARLVEHADDFVNGHLGGEVVMARMRAALRLRAYVDRLECITSRLSEELRLAGNLQRMLLPPPLQHHRLEVELEYLPVHEIGGDFVDLVPLGPGRLALAIGDVMGKGVPAALLASALKACLRAHLQAGEASGGQLVARIDTLFREVSPRGLFASLFVALFDLEAGVLESVNAGHPPPFLIRGDGVVRRLDTGGRVLGLLESGPYLSERLQLTRGDHLVLYTDGVSDREDRRGRSYGAERLQEAAARSRGDTARIVLYTLLGDVQGWADGVPADDDMTLVVARVR